MVILQNEGEYAYLWTLPVNIEPAVIILSSDNALGRSRHTDIVRCLRMR
jgi:hypothetical protein